MADLNKPQNVYARKLPSVTFLAECFRYNHKTGVLKWKIRPIGHFTSKRDWLVFKKKHAGKTAGCKKSKDKKYCMVSIGSLGILRVHRIIWKMMTGRDPDVEVEHWDLDGFNNKWSNLREATRSQNMANISVSSKNKLGVKRVYQVGNRYRAMISVNNKSVHIGYFGTPEEASDAYFIKAKELFGEFARAS